MKRTLTNVFDPGEPWTNDHGTFYPVTGMFDDGSVLTANKKTQEAATELHGILTDILDEECDFYCDDKGRSAKGNQKWALKAILNLEGGAIYGKPPTGQGGGGGPSVEYRGSGRTIPPATPEKDEDIRWAVALKCAAAARPGQPGDVILDLAIMFYQFDFRAVVGSPSPTAQGALSQPPGSAPTTSASGEAHTVAGQPGPPSTSDADSSDGIVVGASDAESGVGTSGALLGEGSTSCPPHDPDRTKEPKGMGRYPCRKCGAYVR